MIDKIVKGVNRAINPYRRFGFQPFFSDPTFDAFFKDFDNFPLSTQFSQFKSFSPLVDVKETETSYELTADVPGFTKDNLKIDLNEETRMLTLKGETKVEKDEKDKDGKFLVQERSSSSFERRFTLPEDAKLEELKAQMKDGQLKIVLEKLKPEPKSLPKVRNINISDV